MRGTSTSRNAIGFMVAAGVVFTGSSALSKYLVETYPVGEVLFARGFGGFLMCAAIVLPTTGLAVFRTRRFGAHVIRGVSQTTSQTLLLIAFSMMPLAAATAINFSSPLFATLASAIFLKEAIGKARAFALVVGFVGVLIVTNPGADTFTVGALFALGNAILFGTVTAGVRGMTATEFAETLTLHQLWMLGFLLFADAAVRLRDAELGGCRMAGAQRRRQRACAILVDAGAALAPTAAVVPFNYLSLVWAMLFGFAIWGDMPTVALLVGSAVVVGSGLFLLWHESRPKLG